MAVEFAYLAKDNSIDLILESNGTAVDLAAVTDMNLNFPASTGGYVTVESSNATTQAITWAKLGYVTGEIRINLAKSTVVRDKVGPGGYKPWLVVYDLSATNGIVWGQIPMTINDNVKGSSS